MTYKFKQKISMYKVYIESLYNCFNWKELKLTLWWSIVAAAAKGDGGKPGGACPRRSIASAKLCPEGAILWFISGDNIIIHLP